MPAPAQNSATIREQAADWWARLDGGSLDENELKEFQRWLNASLEHRLAYSELENLWGELDGLAKVETSVAPKSKPPAKRALAPLIFGLALAAGLAAIWLSPHLQLWNADLQTGRGEIRSFTLSDGSTVHLNRASALDIQIDETRRELHLLRGEAAFEVSPDRNRPFRVYAAGGSVTALGTAFNVKLAEEGAEVTVTEHRVWVEFGNGRQTAEIDEGLAAGYDAEHGLSQAKAADIGAATAWRRHRLVFQNRPLDEVVAELAHYYPGVLLIQDADLRQRRVNGVFRIDDPLAAIAALETALQLHTTRFGDYLILLHR